MLEDLTGKRFGKLVVLGYDHSEKKSRYWKCQCDCGNTSVVSTKSLNIGNTASCGCGKVTQIIDLTGQRFGRLIVLGMCDHETGQDVRWNCRCDCGKELSVSGHSLKRGMTRSCGCYQKDRAAELGKSKALHDGKGTRLYELWKGVRSRCNNPNHKSYHNYGGLGIKMCREWDDYTKFRDWAIANGYDENAPKFQCTLDRIDVTKGYSPDNCRWVDAKTQSRNTRRNIRVEYQGESYVAKDLADKFGMDDHALIHRLNLGLSLEDALTIPKGTTLSPGAFSPVVCVETSERFPSVKSAAESVSRHESTVIAALKNHNRTAGGYHWRYADN